MPLNNPVSSGARTIASGATALAGLATTTITTFNRNAGERVYGGFFQQDNIAGETWAEQNNNVVGVTPFFERTAVANEGRLRATNGNGAARTYDWIVKGE